MDPSVYDPPHSKMSLMFYVPGPFTPISTATFKSNIMLQLSHDSKDCTCVTIPLRGGTAPLDGGVLPLLLSSPTACTPESSPLVPNKSILMYSALSGPRELKPRWTHKKPAACICGCPLSHILNTAYCDKMRTRVSPHFAWKRNESENERSEIAKKKG